MFLPFRGGVYEEEDFQPVSYSFKLAPEVTSQRAVGMLREVEEDLQRTIRATKKKNDEEQDEETKKEVRQQPSFFFFYSETVLHKLSCINYCGLGMSDPRSRRWKGVQHQEDQSRAQEVTDTSTRFHVPLLSHLFSLFFYSEVNYKDIYINPVKTPSFFHRTIINATIFFSAFSTMKLQPYAPASDSTAPSSPPCCPCGRGRWRRGRGTS